MTYLFSQIAMSLALAAIVGGALGWLLHRARAGKQIKQLQSIVKKQQVQVSQAQTDVAMLTDDFDDLKQHSESEINQLRQDNQKIPALNQNLEKSQLLVRQLLQKHEAEVRELSLENEKLVANARLLEERDKSVVKLQTDLDIARRRNRELTGESTESQSELFAEDTSESTSSESTKPDSTKTKDASHANSQTHDDAKLAALNNAINYDAKAEKGSHSDMFATTLAANGVSADSEDSPLPSAAETEAELLALRDQLADGTPAKKHNGRIGHTLSETTVDENALEPIFDPVDQHDDLKQIFGIGPVTEKTLNKLGITAYSQLAELKQHDIEKIAEALQIFPGRIERDNWVGSARTQLEEVLEDL